jgi:hypothetical protein
MSFAISRVIFLVIISFLCGDEQAYFLSKGFQEEGGVKSFFHDKDTHQLQELAFHDNLRISIYAEWILCQRFCIASIDDSVQKNHRHEFLGFLRAKLSMTLPTWWTEAILSLHASLNYVAPSAESLKWHEGLSITQEFTCSEEIEVLSLAPRRLRFSVLDDIVDIKQQGSSWEEEDMFVMESPACLAFAKERSRQIVGVADKFQPSFRVFCVDDEGRKLWSAEVDSMPQLRVGGNLPSTNGLLHIETNSKHLAVFWLNETAASLTVIAIETGEILCRFTTALNLEK